MSRAAYEAWAKSKGIDATKIDGMERDDQCILLWSAWVGGMEFKPKQPPLEQDAMGIAMVAAWSIGGRTDAVHPDFQRGFEAGWEAKPPKVLTNIKPEFLAREAGFRDGYSQGYDAAMRNLRAHR